MAFILAFEFGHTALAFDSPGNIIKPEDVLADKALILEQVNEVIDSLNTTASGSSVIDVSEVMEVLGQIAALLDGDPCYIDLSAPIIEASPNAFIAQAEYGHIIKVGSVKLKVGSYNFLTGEIIGRYEDIFKGLGGKITRDKKTGGVSYKYNGITRLYTILDEPKDEMLSADTVLNMYGMLERKGETKVTTKEKIDKKTQIVLKTIHTITMVKPKLPPKVKVEKNLAQSTKEFFQGFGSAIVEDVQSGLWVWIVKQVTGLSIKKAPTPASLKDPKAFYLGRVVGHAISVAIGAGESAFGVLTAAAAIGTGGFTALMSGGALSLAGVSISAAGMTAGGVLVADGTTIASKALYSMGADISNYKYCSSGGKIPKKVNYDNKQLGDKWGEHMQDYPKLKSHTEYKKLANEVFSKSDKIIFDSKYNEFYYLKGNDLLRLNPNGDFISLYPGANSSRVLDVINSALK